MIPGQLPPHDLDAEAAVISACLLDPHAVDDVADVLRSDDCFSDSNAAVLRCVLDLHSEGTAPDPVSVANRLRAEKLLKRAGGVSYLGQLVDATPSVSNVSQHARIVRDLSRVRKTIAACHKMASEGYEAAADPGRYVESVESALFDIASEKNEGGPARLRDVLTKTYRRLSEEGPHGVPVGLTALDRFTGGFGAGDLVVLAARPGMGKTALAIQFARHVAETKTVLFLSLEMPEEQLAQRILASDASVDLGRMRRHDLNADEWNRITQAAQAIAPLPLLIDETPSLSLVQARSRARRVARRAERAGQPLGLVIVDYLQLMRHPEAKSREQEVSEISRGLKALAKDLGCPVIALSQLNRKAEERKDRRPMLSDLRESGAVEQDSDTVIMVFRPGYYLKQTGQADDSRGATELIVAKQRNGPTGRCVVTFNASSATFGDDEGGQW